LTAKAREAGHEANRAKAEQQAADLAPVIKELQASGATSLQAIADGLNERGIPAASGGQWSSPQVMRVLERMDDSPKNTSTLWREAQELIGDGGLVVDAADPLDVIEQVMHYFYGLGVQGSKNKAPVDEVQKSRGQLKRPRKRN
jgi:hypothetical protein